MKIICLAVLLVMTNTWGEIIFDITTAPVKAATTASIIRSTLNVTTAMSL